MAAMQMAASLACQGKPMLRAAIKVVLNPVTFKLL